jgi:hypothetical protein
MFWRFYPIAIPTFPAIADCPLEKSIIAPLDETGGLVLVVMMNDQ